MSCSDFEIIPDELLAHATQKERAAYAAALARCTAHLSPLDFALATRPGARDYAHSRYISDLIANLDPGKKLLITMPPRGGKSYIVSEGTPAWLLSSNPNVRVGHATYGADFTIVFGREIRRILQENAGTLSPRLASDAKAALSFLVHPRDGRGYYFGDGVGGGFTGRGFDWMILDDLVKNAEEADSKVMRDKTWKWIDTVADTRMEPGGRILGIATPWHEDDWTGRARNSKDWICVNLPALAEENDPLGREVGEALNRERFDEAHFLAKKAASPMTFSAMYQGHPSPEDGDVFSKSKVVFYEELPSPDKWGPVFATVDLAHSKKTRADWSVISFWMITKPPRPRLYWISMIRDRVSSGDHLDWIDGAVKGMEQALKPRWIVVGDKTFGSSLMDAARKHPRPGLVFKAVKEETDKWTKAQAAASINKQGLLYMPKDAVWLADALPELTGFDNAAHDDIVDTLSYAGLEYNQQPWLRKKNAPDAPSTIGERIREQIKKRKVRSSKSLRKALMR